MNNTGVKYDVLTGIRIFCTCVIFIWCISPVHAQEVQTTVADTVKINAQDEIHQIKSRRDHHVITKDNRNLAATFGDPSRVLYRHAGITLQNDQNNSIIYRGLPSEYIQWSISGSEIVNPNHLANAGRITDDVSPSAGGVLGIPFDVINRFNFYGNPYSNMKLSSLSGVAELEFDNRSDNFLKIGLLGVEGGLQTREKVPTTIHARYSTVGLLNDFGVDFDGERIKFYDLFSRTELTDELTAVFSRGISNNMKAARDSAMVETVKDIQDISFKSDYWIGGLTYKARRHEHSMFYSRKYSERSSMISEAYGSLQDLVNTKFSVSDLSIFSYDGRYKWYHASGVINLNTHLKISEYDASTNFMITNDFNDSYFKAAINADQLLSWSGFALRIIPEFSASYFLDLDNGFHVEPSIFMILKKADHNIEANASYKMRKGIGVHRIINSEFTNHLDQSLLSGSVAYRYKETDSATEIMLRAYLWIHNGAELLFRYLRNQEPLAQLNNYQDWFYLASQSYQPSERLLGKGLELLFNKRLARKWFFSFNATYMNTGPEASEQYFNQDLRYAFNSMVNYKRKFKSGGELMINLAFHARDGAMVYAFNPKISEFVDTRLSAYNRIDLRLQWSKNKSSWTLDIQNVMSRANEAYLYYDPYLEQAVVERQLTMIPVLSYRRQFN